MPPITLPEGTDLSQEKNAKALREWSTEEEKKALKEVINQENEVAISGSKESPFKMLEQERKSIAIAELDRLGMKTDENVGKINAIQFLDDKIIIGNTPWAYENMRWGKWVYKQETNEYYYNLKERKAEAKKQWIVLPEKKDFVDTLKALPGERDVNDRYRWWHILSIVLWESLTGYCEGSTLFGSSTLLGRGKVGYLGSVSDCGDEYDIYAQNFIFNRVESKLDLVDPKRRRTVCRPLIKNS